MRIVVIQTEHGNHFSLEKEGGEIEALNTSRYLQPSRRFSGETFLVYYDEVVVGAGVFSHAHGSADTPIIVWTNGANRLTRKGADTTRIDAHMFEHQMEIEIHPAHGKRPSRHFDQILWAELTNPVEVIREGEPYKT